MMGCLAITLILFLGTQPARAEPKTIMISGNTASAKSCGQEGSALLEKAVAAIEEQLKASAVYRVIKSKPKPGPSTAAAATYVLGLDLLCQPGALELNAALIEVASKEVHWSAREELSRPAEIPFFAERLAKKLVAFAAKGTMARDYQDPAAKGSLLSQKNLALLPLRDTTGKLSVEQLQRLQLRLKMLLIQKTGCEVMPEQEIASVAAGCDKAGYTLARCASGIGKDFAVDNVLSLEIQPEKTGCQWSAKLLEAGKGKVERTATATGGCTEDGLVTSFDTILDQLRR
jgi:hypothetical protein